MPGSALYGYGDAAELAPVGGVCLMLGWLSLALP